MDGLRKKVSVAARILRAAQKHLPERLGVTIIVHGAQLQPGEIEMAITTTLPSRQHQRALVAEALCNMALADGKPLEDAGTLAVRDLAEVSGRGW